MSCLRRGRETFGEAKGRKGRIVDRARVETAFSFAPAGAGECCQLIRAVQKRHHRIGQRVGVARRDTTTVDALVDGLAGASVVGSGSEGAPGPGRGSGFGASAGWLFGTVGLGS